jgi:hypothetical protein
MSTLKDQEHQLDSALNSVHSLRANTRSILESWATVHENPQDVDRVQVLVEKAVGAVQQVQATASALPQRIQVADLAPGKITCS